MDRFIAAANKLFIFLLGESWRTSLAGYGGAVAIAVEPLLRSGELPSWGQLIIAVSLAVVARMARDLR